MRCERCGAYGGHVVAGNGRAYCSTCRQEFLVPASETEQPPAERPTVVWVVLLRRYESDRWSIEPAYYSTDTKALARLGYLVDTGEIYAGHVAAHFTAEMVLDPEAAR